MSIPENDEDLYRRHLEATQQAKLGERERCIEIIVDHMECQPEPVQVLLRRLVNLIRNEG